MKKLKEILKKILDDENEISAVEVTSSTLEEALQDAASQLGVDLSEIDYEVENFGSKGVFGIGKKDFKIKVYKTKSVTEVFDELSDFAEEVEDIDIHTEEVVKNKDGEAFLRITARGALLKIIPPLGDGRAITESDVNNMILARGLENYDKDIVKINKTD